MMEGKECTMAYPFQSLFYLHLLFFPIHISVFSNTQDEFGYNGGCDSERSSISSHILLDGVDTVVDFS